MKIFRFYFFFVLRYIQYFFRAKTRYDIHSPFVYQLLDRVLEDRRWFYAFSMIEPLRNALLQDRSTIAVRDHGAGSQVLKGPEKTVRDIVRYSAVSPRLGRLLFRLTDFFKPKTVLELGTSFGISTLYLAGGAPRARILTVEGCPGIAARAQQNFQQLGMGQIESVNVPFESALPLVLPRLERLDLLYQDGDHRPESSYRYFEQCLPYAHADSVFVIADIHWSAAMESAWQKMKAHPEVTLSIDLFHFGLLFFRKEQQKKTHYTVIKSSYKPWRMGFWR